MKIVIWGTCDLGMPRARILHQGLQENDVQIHYCHWNIWASAGDKSQLNFAKKTWISLKWLVAMPLLSLRYLFMPSHDLVLVSYPAQFDMPFIWLLTRLRRKPLVWDAFLSLYDTTILDRKLAAPTSLTAKALFTADKFACKLADHTLLDTNAHAQFFEDCFDQKSDSISHVWVGAECENFDIALQQDDKDTSAYEVLFYGQLIPLHGLATILAAAEILKHENIQFTIIGDGQERIILESALNDPTMAATILWKKWIPYESLSQQISESDICLGIFSAGDKASRVIANKVFQCLATGKPVITRQSPAMNELPDDLLSRVHLVPPEDPEALASAIIAARQAPNLPKINDKARDQIAPKAIGAQALDVLNIVLSSKANTS